MPCKTPDPSPHAPIYSSNFISCPSTLHILIAKLEYLMFYPTLHALLQFHGFAHAVPLLGIPSFIHLTGQHLSSNGDDLEVMGDGQAFQFVLLGPNVPSWVHICPYSPPLPVQGSFPPAGPADIRPAPNEEIPTGLNSLTSSPNCIWSIGLILRGLLF